MCHFETKNPKKIYGEETLTQTPPQKGISSEFGTNYPYFQSYSLKHTVQDR